MCVMGSRPCSGMVKSLIFGWHLALDLTGCNDNILNADKLKQFAKELCVVLDMKPYGECQTPYFGLESEITKGHSLVQLIETSCITAHFSDFYKSAHIDIFSCKQFDPAEASDFAVGFFGGKLKGLEFRERFCL